MLFALVQSTAVMDNSILNWLAANWFSLFQSSGIVGGLLFTGFSLRQNTKAQRLANLFQLTQSHREIWSEVLRNANLHRILDASANLVDKPVTLEEQVFVTLKLLHLNCLYEAKEAKALVPVERVEDDLRDFINLPIPRAVWQEMRVYLNRGFVAFVDRLTVSIPVSSYVPAGNDIRVSTPGLKPAVGPPVTTISEEGMMK